MKTINYSIKERIRFAPNVNELLHLGNARTALVCYYYARAKGYKFHLRIDDDPSYWLPILERKEKNKKVEFKREANIIKDLYWLGVEWDENYRLSSRTGLAMWAIDNLQKENVYPYRILKDSMTMSAEYTSMTGIITSFFDDVFSNTPIQIRGNDLVLLEKFEDCLRNMGRGLIGSKPDYLYLPVLGSNFEVYHKTLDNSITIKECREKGYKSTRLVEYLFKSFGLEKIEDIKQLVVSDSFRELVSSKKYTEIDKKDFYEFMEK